MKKITQLLFISSITLIPVILVAQEIDPTSLDAFVTSTIQKMNIAGASVLVAQQGKIVLNKGYGFADLSHNVPATPETTYFLVGPGGILLSASILQLIEQGKISLDDDASTYLPDFPWQGHRVKIRHLLSSTSGIIDYHYLGDPLESTYRTPKASDEVIGLFAGKPFTAEVPGSKWDWSISNFALLVEILEKVTGSSYKDYLQKNIIAPLGLLETTYIEEKQLLKNFARGYGKQGDELYPTYQSLLTYDPSLRISTSTGDLFKIWEGIKNHKIITAKSYTLMTTPEGTAKQISQTDPSLQFGFILRIRKVGEQTVLGLHGALPGYSSHCYYFQQRDLTIIVLANTSNQYANEIGQAIGLKLLDLPATPERTTAKNELANHPVTREEQKTLTGTYTLRLVPDPQRHRSYDFYNRTLRVLVEHGQLELQKLGDSPEPLLKQDDGSYATNSSPSERLTFDVQNGKAVSIAIAESGKVVSKCARVGEGDVGTFHGAGINGN